MTGKNYWLHQWKRGGTHSVILNLLLYLILASISFIIIVVGDSAV